MNRTLLTIIFCVIILAAFPTNVQGCTCIGKSTVKKSFKGSDGVFIGTVLSIDTVTIVDTIFRSSKDSSVIISASNTVKRVRVLIQKSYKGKYPEGHIEIVETGLGDGDCGYDFTVGLSYLIYGFFENRYINKRRIKARFLVTNTCTRTSVNSSELNRELVKLQKLGGNR